MASATEGLAGFASPWAYVIVGLLALLEASAFLGVVVPGETALLIGGFLAHEGRASLPIMIGVATVGAVVGDSVGYEVGRWLGPVIESSRLGRRIGPARWRRAERFIQQRGGRAVLMGRFVGVLRALVPSLAGAGRMPYRTFLIWNVAGALAWAPSFVVLGYASGISYREVGRIVGTGSLAIMICGAVAVAAVAALRRLRRRSASHLAEGARGSRT